LSSWQKATGANQKHGNEKRLKLSYLLLPHFYKSMKKEKKEKENVSQAHKPFDLERNHNLIILFRNIVYHIFVYLDTKLCISK